MISVDFSPTKNDVSVCLVPPNNNRTDTEERTFWINFILIPDRREAKQKVLFFWKTVLFSGHIMALNQNRKNRFQQWKYFVYTLHKKDLDLMKNFPFFFPLQHKFYCLLCVCRPPLSFSPLKRILYIKFRINWDIMGTINYYLKLALNEWDLFMIIIWLGNIYVIFVRIKQNIFNFPWWNVIIHSFFSPFYLITVSHSDTKGH